VGRWGLGHAWRLLVHRQRDARCLFGHEELPRLHEQIQENPAELMRLSEVSVRSCIGANRLYNIDRGLGAALCLKRSQGSSTESFPADSLVAPVRKHGDRQDVPKLDRVTALDRAGQEKNLFLQIGSKT
jgi:hypothetical protein